MHKINKLNNILWETHNNPMFILSKSDFNKYALEIMDVILNIHGGASSADATAEGNANFQKM